MFRYLTYMSPLYNPLVFRIGMVKTNSHTLLPSLRIHLINSASKTLIQTKSQAPIDLHAYALWWQESGRGSVYLGLHPTWKMLTRCPP